MASKDIYLRLIHCVKLACQFIADNLCFAVSRRAHVPECRLSRERFGNLCILSLYVSGLKTLLPLNFKPDRTQVPSRIFRPPELRRDGAC